MQREPSRGHVVVGDGDGDLAQDVVAGALVVIEQDQQKRGTFGIGILGIASGTDVEISNRFCLVRTQGVVQFVVPFGGQRLLFYGRLADKFSFVEYFDVGVRGGLFAKEVAIFGGEVRGAMEGEGGAEAGEGKIGREALRHGWLLIVLVLYVINPWLCFGGSSR